jgi:hypothetical protein
LYRSSHVLSSFLNIRGYRNEEYFLRLDRDTENLRRNEIMDAKPAIQPINSKLAATYSLSSTPTSRLFITKNPGRTLHVCSRASSSFKKKTFEDADMLAVSRKLQVQGYMSGNLYFSK